MKRKIVSALLAAMTVTAVVGQSTGIWAASEKLQPRILEKSDSGNPMLGFDEKGEILYGGDPSILVDGDTVYCYVGHDVSSNESYNMTDWRCYSSKDMKNWKLESTIMSGKDISWAANDHETWAAQVVKYKDKYYFYYCTEASRSNGGGKSIGVAVSDSPKGPFKDIGRPLVRNIDTPNGPHTWEDIDPTFWIETDENGEEHRVLGWGNNRFFNCEMEEDMITIKDRDGNPNNLSTGFGAEYDIAIGKMDGKEITSDKVLFDGHHFTEAPYYYRQQDENGNYVGKYYMFFACDWREQMAYATADTYEEFINNDWSFGGVLMEPSATANTNHSAVFDFKGQTYFVYHDGSLPHGSGYRRVACVEPLTINKDGSIDEIKKTAVGLTGTSTLITDFDGGYVSHKSFENILSDSFYPIKGKELKTQYTETEESSWEINPGKWDKNDEQLVSIESNNKPGLYLTAEDPKNGASASAVLSQDVMGTQEEAQSMTFRTWKGKGGKGVIFESVKYPGYYLTSRQGTLTMENTLDEKAATFYVSADLAVNTYEKGNVSKTKRYYGEGDTLNTDDIQILLYQENGEVKEVKEYTTNAEEIDMTSAGQKALKVTYKYNGKSYTEDIKLTVVEREYLGK